LQGTLKLEINQRTGEKMHQPQYALGHSPWETRRLMAQSQLYAPITRHLLTWAGIQPGMRVLDLGTGAGDVALLLADYVGPTGEVVGIDRDPEILKTAQARSLPQMTFRVGDIQQLAEAEKFDAVVGRLILMYQPDPVATLRQLHRILRPGGIVAFQEWTLTGSKSFYPEAPLWQQTAHWIGQTFRQAGVQMQMGLKFAECFEAAGLPIPQLHLEAPMGSGAQWAGYDYFADTLHSLLPLAIKLGITTAEAVQIETLGARLRAEAVNQGGVRILGTHILAWTRLEA